MCYDTKNMQIAICRPLSAAGAYLLPRRRWIEFVRKDKFKTDVEYGKDGWTCSNV